MEISPRNIQILKDFFSKMEDRKATEFDNLVDKVNEHIMIYGNLDLLSDYERSKIDEWQIPVMKTFNEFDKALADEWHTTMVFGADSINHVLEEYIGAPCGSEDNTAKATYLELHGTGYRYGIDYPKEGVNSRQTINLQDTGQHTMDQWIKSLTSDVTERPKKEEVRDNRTYSEQLEDKYREQLAKDMEDWQLVIQDVMMGRRVPGPGLYKYLEMDLDYSKLSNVNINNGQDSTFSFNNSFKEEPAPQGSKPSDFLEEHIKLVDKLVNKSKTYRPLPDCLTIKESSIDGLGVFATEDIHELGWKDPHVWKTHTLLVYTDDCGNKVEELLRSSLGGYINHSSTPNCTLGKISGLTTDDIIVEKYYLRPLRDIEAGEEILLNYNNELCGLSDYDGAEFLKEDNLEDRVYENSVGVRYYYNSTYGKYETGNPARFGNWYPIFYTLEDAEKYLKRVEQ